MVELLNDNYKHQHSTWTRLWTVNVFETVNELTTTDVISTMMMASSKGTRARLVLHMDDEAVPQHARRGRRQGKDIMIGEEMSSRGAMPTGKGWHCRTHWQGKTRAMGWSRWSGLAWTRWASNKFDK